MSQPMPISSILVNRTVRPADDLTKLVESIRETGQQVPILVTHGHMLIDGLRRIKALQLLGHETVDVVVTNLYRPAVAWLKRAREHGVEAQELTPRRIWELYDICRPLMNVSRSQMMKGTQHGTGVRVGGRREFINALGIEKEAYLQAVCQTYRTAQEPTDRGSVAREMVAAIDIGVMTPYMALDRLRRYARRGTVVGATEQLSALRTATSALTGIAFGLSNLGPVNPDLGPQDIDDVLRDLRRFRRTLQRTIHTLEKEQESR